MVKGGAVAGRAVLTGLMFLLIPARVFADCWSTSFSGYNPIWTTPEDALDYATQHLADLYAGQMVCVYKTNPDDQFGTWEPLIGIRIVSESVIAWSSPDTGWASLTNEGAGIPVGYEAVIAGYSAHPEALCRIQWSVDAGNISYYWEPGVSGYDASPEYIQKCRSQSYVIKITRADGSTQDATNVASGAIDTVEPTDIFSIASEKNSTFLIARVYNQNNQLVPNVNIKLIIDVKANSGGHNHDDLDRHTNYRGRLDAPQGTTSPDGSTLEGNTGAYGLAFTFSASPPAGDHYFTTSSSCTDTGATCTLQGPNTIQARIKDLEWIADSPYYALLTPNRDTNHPGDHYLTADATTKLQELASQYHDTFPTRPKLYLNDSSLQYGGVFDISYGCAPGSGACTTRPKSWWTVPHSEHRRGVVIDIDSTSMPLRNYQTFIHIAKLLQMSVFDETDCCRHFHVRLIGLSQ
jgi:hypothetical protein